MNLNLALSLFKKNVILSILLVICLFGSLKILYSASFIQENHYIGLANSFLQGKLDIGNPKEYFATNDISKFRNKYFVYFGPTPAILALPLAFFKSIMISQQLVGFTMFILDFFLLYKIALSFKISRSDCIWLVIFFMFGTIFLDISLINITAYQVQCIATSFFILTLHEFFHRKRWLLMGFWLSLAATTRPMFYLTSIFFLMEVMFSSGQWKSKLKNTLLFSLPLLISFLTLGYYNYERFGNFTDTGYPYSISLNKGLSEALSHGLFSIQHIPGNLYFLLFKWLDPIRLNSVNYILKFPYFKASPWGMGIFFTSPLFLYIFVSKIKAKYVLSAGITAILVLTPALAYFGIGTYQYGYRYAIDIYPFLFIILLSVFKNGLTTFAKILIVYSIFFNFFFVLSIWDIYPFI